jgi:hypothetical protein
MGVTSYIMRNILTDNLETKLGEIRLCIESDLNESFECKDDIIKTSNYLIQIKKLPSVENLFSTNLNIESSKAWRIYITKRSDFSENLKIYCKLKNSTRDIQSYHDSGERLDAIGIEDNENILHIGTEDGEAMQNRSNVSDWFPSRFKKVVSIENSFTKYSDLGFETCVPYLENGEKIYFHYIVATNSKNRNKADTWFAVGIDKQELDY